MSQIHVFAGSPLDRAANLRRDETWVAHQRTLPAARYLPLWRLQAFATGDAAPQLAWQEGTAVSPHLAAGAPAVFLGLADGAPRFAIDISDAADEPGAVGLSGGAFAEVRGLAAVLPGGDSAVLAQARTLLDWHRRHRFCAVCGAPTRMAEAGYVRVCTAAACAANHFPRTDPVVIALITRPGCCLLGRSARFPTSVYSALAGFMEPGETIEEAVRREVMEESGVTVGAVRYHSSQPWPFPASLMIGCIGEAESVDITVDPVEIEDARWFDVDQVRRALAGGDGETGLRLPQPMAIAHQLIRAWIATASA